MEQEKLVCGAEAIFVQALQQPLSESVCVCVGGRAVIAAPQPPPPEPWCRLGELEESFHLGGNERTGAVRGGEAEEAKLQSGAVWQPAARSDPLS